MVERQLPKLHTRVRFSSPAPNTHPVAEPLINQSRPSAAIPIGFEVEGRAARGRRKWRKRSGRTLLSAQGRTRRRGKGLFSQFTLVLQQQCDSDGVSRRDVSEVPSSDSVSVEAVSESPDPPVFKICSMFLSSVHTNARATAPVWRNGFARQDHRSKHATAFDPI